MNIERHLSVTPLRSCLLALCLLTAATLVCAATATVPNAPTIGTVTPGSGQAVVAFTVPTSVSGVTITGYTASCTPSGSSVAVTATGTTTPITVTGLTNATTYTCSVKGNYSASSASSTAVLSAVTSTPGAPTVVKVLLGSTSALVYFTAPTSTGGSSITSYTASCKSGTSAAIFKTGTTSPITVTGLSNGLSYTCTVTASNVNGSGTVSSSSSTFTPSATALSSPILGTLTPSSSQISVAFTKGASGTPTSYTASCTAASSTFTQTGSSTATTIVVTGLSASTVYACSVTAYSGTAYAVSSSTSVTTSVAFSTPSTFETVIGTAPSTALSMPSATTTLTNRSRYMISDSSSATTTANYLSIGPTYTTSGYTVISGNLPSGSTYNAYLNKTIQFTQDTSDDSGTYYRLDSHLHPNNSLDVATTNYANASLKFRNNFGKAVLTTSPAPGYVTFSYDTSTKKFKAKRRYVYSYTCTTASNTTSCPSTYTSTEISGNYYLTYTAGSYSLTTSGTALYLYATPLSLGIPSFMNPKGTTFVTNSAYNFLTGKSTVLLTEGAYTTSGNGSTTSCSTGSTYTALSDTYRPQVCYPGTNATTRAAAVTQLAAIQAAVTANGESLRYSTDAYLAFRDGLLAHKLVSDSIADGTPGQNMVPFVYFTNEYAGNALTKSYHPMMVIVSYGNQASPNGLKDVPRPPGASSTGCANYDCSPVTRYTNLENYVLTIPMKDYGRITSPAQLQADTSLSKSLCSDDDTCKLSTSNKTVYNYADAADNGILVNGAVMFPLFNNALYPSPIAGELSASGCHVGQGGGGPHCHSDGYQSDQGLGLYNDADYGGKTHPPLIGFGYDGIALFGQYRGTTDSSLLGYSTALDDFGAHNHDSIGYHYHAHTTSWTGTIAGSNSASTTTNLAVLMKGAYIGTISSVPYFRSSCSAKFNVNKYLGGRSVTSTTCN